MHSLLRSTWGLVGIALVGLVLLFAVGLLMFPPPSPQAKRSSERGREHDEAVAQAQEILAKATEFGTCRSALQQLNVGLSQHPEHRPEPLTEEQRARLADPKGFGLRADALAEVENPNFTALDAHHIETFVLLQDVCHSLDLDGLSQAEKAGLAFAWVMRQVRLLERDEALAPPEFVLHRGWGTAGQRALIFVTLLQQLDIPGCVLATRMPENRQLQPWACGALVAVSGDQREVLLFDPRLGLPLPGPKGSAPDLAAAFRWALPLPFAQGEQPASLAAVRRQPELLQALSVDNKHPYDVTARQVADSHLYLVGMLSALAPRMKYLQDQLPAARSSLHLTFDPDAELARWRVVAGSLGAAAPEVEFWQEATRVAFQVWPPEEGGSDRTNYLRSRAGELVAWYALPQQLREIPGDLGAQLQGLFTQRFVVFSFNPGMPPDLMLHGRFDEAAQALVQTRDQMREQKARLAAAVGLDAQVREWSDQLVEARANLNRAEHGGKGAGVQPGPEEARARFDRVWKEGQDALSVLIEGRVGQVLLPDATYLLALCKQEQAERLQLQLERARQSGRSVPEPEVQATQEAWTDARSWWLQYAADLAAAGSAGVGTAGSERAPQHGSAAAARLHQARAEEALGAREEARRLLADLSGMTPLEQTSRLYLARPLKKP
jgi:hypothetical protein